ncbi:helix-turn-helix domain-containing protein [Pontibacter cellulosilyticus]|uniref:Helix-turn-helix transcriptional regulator n=1 Tax=Pontibacter cellulosilyticus TaxID=1720253 RepID=A0A923SHA1_9BACT|nr:AraC family transcriptional regulator [Pontibacter cellulosilyticus]MBC5991524.1 helix-turn-helix transcriptional regulator [Pontibacter cellulosilyticus]
MFHKEFPDYTWLKQQTEKAFREPINGQANKFVREGWPVVIMNATSTFCHRPDLKGPFSIFTNISGSSSVQVGSRRVTVSEDSFIITNKAQYYTLDIDSSTPIETFNLHLGQDVWEEYTYSCASTDLQQLDSPEYSQYTTLAEFPNLLQTRNQSINAALAKLYSLSQNPNYTKLQLDEHLVLLFQALAGQKRELLQAASRIPQAKQSTRAELHKRISLATDFILSNPSEQCTLDELASMACMSKFHFLRTFTSIYRSTPHQFILGQRLQRSQRLLRKTNLSVGEVGTICGFPEIVSFSRAFTKYTGCSPAVFRQKSK